MMKRTWIFLAAIAMVAGCRGKLAERIESVAADQQALAGRVEALELENARLRTALAASRAAAVRAAGLASVSSNAPAVDMLSPALAEALADRVNTLLQEKVDATVEQGIANRIGTRDDIEAIFSEVVDEELDSREEQERRAREERRLQQIAERDQREIGRRAEVAGLDDAKRDAVARAVQEMRERLRRRLPELKRQGTGMEPMLAVVAESRQVLESELLDTLTEEELQAYYEADRWYGRQQSRVKEIATTAGLDETQGLQVEDAYATMREKIGDGFTLESEGYVDRGGMRQNFSTSREAFTESLKAIMTPEQFATYESSDSGRRRRGSRGGGPPF